MAYEKKGHLAGVITSCCESHMAHEMSVDIVGAVTRISIMRGEYFALIFCIQYFI